MPAPVVGPCGGPNQPACPPVPATPILAPGESIARAFMDMTPEEQHAAVAANTDHRHHHFWQAFVEALRTKFDE